MEVRILSGPSKRMRVWVDDERERPEGFDIQAKTASSAVMLLKSGEVKLISLDHDLGSEQPNETGYFIAQWIELAAHNGWIPALEWRIHSANPVGRSNMEAALRNADRYWKR